MPARASLRLGLLALLAAFPGGCRTVPAGEQAKRSPLIGAPEAEADLEGPAFSRWARECGDGEEAACHRLYASILHAGRLDIAHRPETLGGLERGCDRGLGDACGGGALVRSLLEGGALDTAAFERACSLGSSWSCVLAFTSGAATPDDDAGGTSWLQRGMERCQEVGDVCFAVAGALEDLPSAPITPAALLRQGCAQSDSLSCFTLARMQVDRQGLPAAPPAADPGAAPASSAEGEQGAHDASLGEVPAPSAPRAATLAGRGPAPGAEPAEEARRALAIACDDDIGPACHLLALQLFRGDGGPASPREARARSRAACTLGTREACDFLAQTNDGRTFPPPEGAAAYADASTFGSAQRRYCHLGGLKACVQLARVRLQAGRNAPTLAPVQEGLGLLSQSCEAGEATACQSLLGLVGGATAACRSDQDPHACLVAGAVLRDGMEIPSTIGETIAADRERARTSFGLACRAGLQAGCRELTSSHGGDTVPD